MFECHEVDFDLDLNLSVLERVCWLKMTRQIFLCLVVPVCVPHRNVCLTKARGLFALAVSYTEVDQ